MKLRPASFRSAITSLAVLSLAGTAFTGTAFAGAPSIRPGMPPEVRSMRESILPKEAYEALVGQWQAYVKDHPREAVGYVEQYRAMRYAGAGTQEEREALIGRAIEVNPDCPEALEAMAGWKHAFTQARDEGRRFAQRAVELAPAWPEPHFILCSFAMIEGKRDEVREHLDGDPLAAWQIRSGAGASPGQWALTYRITSPATACGADVSPKPRCRAKRRGSHSRWRRSPSASAGATNWPGYPSRPSTVPRSATSNLGLTS